MLSFSLHININNGPIAACNALSPQLSGSQQCDQSWYCVKSTLARAASYNDDGLGTNDDQNDKDDNIDCDQTGRYGAWTLPGMPGLEEH